MPTFTTPSLTGNNFITTRLKLQISTFKDSLFDIQAPEDFNAAAVWLFHYQAANNPVYAEWLQLLRIQPETIQNWQNIPLLPVSFFKTHRVLSGSGAPQISFETSGTTGTQQGYHHITDLQLYETSILKAFERFWGPPADYVFLALLPGYIERPNASLVYMMDVLMRASHRTENGYFLHDHQALANKLAALNARGQKVFLMGVTFALLDFAASHPMPLPHTTIVETGGMKGRRREMVREEVHALLRDAFQVSAIGSEYGMTELLSQGWSRGAGLFENPPWMRVVLKDPQDPLASAEKRTSGMVGVIDLANVHSCAFLATQDLAKMHPNNQYEVLGRFDYADLRGCNLLVR